MGSRLRDLRLDRHESLRALEAAVGISRGVISRWETGKRQPSAAAALFLAQHYGVKVEDLGIEARPRSDRRAEETQPPGGEPSSAEEIREMLARRWPPHSHVLIPEAPAAGDRTGRRLDLLVCSLWGSRGQELDGIEIKVSYGDWAKERDNAAKADWWWRHVHRFWIVAPASVAPRIAPELPRGWGLISCSFGEGTEVTVGALAHAAEALDWNSVLGLLYAVGRRAVLPTDS